MQSNHRKHRITSDDNVRQKIKEKLCDRKIMEYCVGYARLMMENEGAAMSYFEG